MFNCRSESLLKGRVFLNTQTIPIEERCVFMFIAIEMIGIQCQVEWTLIKLM